MQMWILYKMHIPRVFPANLFKAVFHGMTLVTVCSAECCKNHDFHNGFVYKKIQTDKTQEKRNTSFLCCNENPLSPINGLTSLSVVITSCHKNLITWSIWSTQFLLFCFTFSVWQRKKKPSFSYLIVSGLNFSSHDTPLENLEMPQAFSKHSSSKHVALNRDMPPFWPVIAVPPLRWISVILDLAYYCISELASVHFHLDRPKTWTMFEYL